MENEKERQKIQDRIPRLALILTIFGGNVFVTKWFLVAWWKTFSNSAYTQTIYNKEHILVLFLALIASIISIKFIYYIYLELRTLGYYKNDKEHKTSINRADEAYRDVFKTMQLSSKIMLIPSVIIIVTETLKRKETIPFIVYGVCIVGICLVLLHFLRKKTTFFEKQLFNYKIFKKVKSPFESLMEIGYFFILFVILSFTITAVAAGGNKQLEINIDKIKEVPITLTTQNIKNLNIQMKINDKVYIKTEDFEKSDNLVEVFDNSEDLSKKFIDINKVSDEVKKNNYGIQLEKTKYKDKYELELEKYMVEGKNKVEMLVMFTSNDIDKYLNFKTYIYIKKDKIKISEDNIKVSW